MIRRRNRISLLVIATLLMLACVPTLPALPGSTPIPTFDPNQPLTAIAGTAGAAATQTALFAPPSNTPTPQPSSTPTDTPTSTPTFVFILPTIVIPPTQIPVGVSNLAYECQVLVQEPLNESTIPKSTRFDARWTLANIGKEIWDSDNADYRYTKGAKLHTQPIYDFPATISPGVTVELVVNMVAPPDPGTYTTTWQITIGKRQFCPMNLTINVP
ncbi:MAG TPA: NBR1-Ig-like domain-containing protein [Anaerolineales bacterium]|nr:NBR1-Ig-like domain-containing protein [Anaerolineales bacterium]